jgi:hypothetical protein
VEPERSSPAANLPQIITDLQATATTLHLDGTGLIGTVEVNWNIDSKSSTVIERFRSLSRIK